ncbi:zinc-ribbon domain containing protein [Alienimonas chondri]|uniref:Probable zinc-binding domain-containing protein n=1 Tax=Alienimonas chondri TaxID=2681879 RepID=A0ABX1V8Z1_9PLAN|nr:zinc-ribbon domain containing protein [Alienimonas chondri]NNJ24367.1 hypothetical protein [Alienimonas chondri]
MPQPSDRYAEFVEHPRFGRGPNLSGLDPDPTNPAVHLHWNTTTRAEVLARYEAAVGEAWPHADLLVDFEPAKRIPNTAIAADLAKQTPATFAVTHYFDLEGRCRDCKRPYIFFAAEQQYWYEELGFGLDSGCVRCVACRKAQQEVARNRETYETLYHVPDRDERQAFKMADACLFLIERGVFATRQFQRVRMLLNTIAEDAEIRSQSCFADLVARLLAAEEESGSTHGRGQIPVL